MKKFVCWLFVLAMYVVVNQDGSIHTIAEKKDDVLYKGQRRYMLNNFVFPEDYDNNFYFWDGGSLVRKGAEEINEIKDERAEATRKANIKKAYKDLKTIEELESIDTNADYTFEKAKYQNLVNKYKKSKKEVV